MSVAATSTGRRPTRSERWLLVAIVAGAVLVRLALMVPALGKLDDPDRYLVIAQSLAEGNGFAINGSPTAYRPPLYPLLLAPLVGSMTRPVLPWGVGALHLILGVGTVVLTHATARRWGLSPIQCLVAAGVVAFDPVLVGQARVVMTETLAAFLVAATLFGLTFPGWRGTALGGLGFGLASLCRPSFLPAALLVAVAGLVVGPDGWSIRIRRSIVLLTVTFVTLLPWSQRNQAIFGETVWTTTHGGYTLALANNWAYYRDVLDGPPDSVWGGANQRTWMFDLERKTRGMSEPEADQFLRSEAIALLKERPIDFGRASIERFKRFWGLAPSVSVYPWWLCVGSFAWTLPLWVALGIGCGRRSIRQWPAIAAPGLIVGLTLVHLVYWTDMRMRAPLVPAIALIAAGMWDCARRIGRFVGPKTARNESGQ